MQDGRGKKMKFSTDHFLYGGDYNPEQWLSTPEILEEDIILMKQAHINAVTLGVFAWSALEPSNNEYHFEWLERIIDRFMKTVFPLFSQPPAGRAPNAGTAMARGTPHGCIPAARAVRRTS